ncbi:MAG TPA: carboxypeptidase regulatory-like domain-containing protein, partial [Pyrinomonadaceae bacterium]
QSVIFGSTPRFHTISGVLSGPNGSAVAGGKVTLSGSKSDTAVANAQGVFVFSDVPRGGSYTVTPAPFFGTTFSPASRSFNNLTSDQGGVYNAVSTAYKITGRVTLGGSAFAGVTVTLSGAQSQTTTTDSAGAYSFDAPAFGDYTVTPSKRNYTFAAPSASFKQLAAPAQAADFAATLNRYKVTGRVTRPDGRAMSGVTVAVSGSLLQTPQTATTDANGDYTLANLPGGGNYTVTPSKPNYDFSPAAKTFSDLGGDGTAPFVVTPANYTVSGRVAAGGAAVSGVTVTLSGSRSATATTDANGAYSFTVSSEGTYTLTPSKAHYTFAPQSVTLADPTSNKTADFAATLDRHKITGRVARADGRALSGATVTLTGALLQTPQTATTDSAGAYSFASLPAGGNYTVAPSKAGYSFSPASKSLNDLGSDQAADFTAAAVNVTLSGRVTAAGGSAFAGVVVTLSGSQSRTATTDAAGAYTFTVSSEGDYTLTPAKMHYTFAPKSLTFANPVSDQKADFAATLDRHTISGRVANPNNYPIAGAAVTLTGTLLQTPQTATTDSNGGFAFTNLAAGGDYTVTPAAPMLAFTPASQSFTNLGADASAGFVGAPATYRLRGRVTEKGAGLDGVTVELTGTQPGLGRVGASAVTAADGTYSFDALAGGDYTVAPSKKGYTFDRPQASFLALASDQTADFAATRQAVFEFAAESYVVTEDGGSVVVTVTRGGNAATAAEVVYQALSGTARRGSDFLASIGLLSFAPGETSKSFAVFITDDSYVEGEESFKLTLEPAGDALVGDGATSAVTIRDNDATPALANPIDDDDFFVRQHYRDFFSREPDAEGLKFWADQIRRCGSDQQCREVARINVSGAFFLSIEFQETGYLVYRAYKAGYGRVPERVSEFMLDARLIGEGVVVGRAGWQDALEANKTAFVRGFVEREEFAEVYPLALTPAQFVDLLFLNAGVTPAAEERRAAVNEFGSAGNTEDTAARARALRRVAENAALAKAETNRAFVLMQYFGYLRRT